LHQGQAAKACMAVRLSSDVWEGGYHSRVLLAEAPKEDVCELMPVARLVGHMLQDGLHVLLLGRPMIARRGLYTGFADRVELEGGLQTAM